MRRLRHVPEAFGEPQNKASGLRESTLSVISDTSTRDDLHVVTHGKATTAQRQGAMYAVPQARHSCPGMCGRSPYAPPNCKHKADDGDATLFQGLIGDP